MAACVAASMIAASVTGTHVPVEDAKLRKAIGEDILQAYMMVAVEIAAGGNDSPVTAPSVLHQGVRAEPNAVASISKGVADVLRDLEKIILSPTPAYYTVSVEDGSENADCDIQEGIEGVIEANIVNEISAKLNTGANDNGANYLISSIPNNGIAGASDLTGEVESAPVISGAAEIRDIDIDVHEKSDTSIISKREGRVSASIRNGSPSQAEVGALTPAVDVDVAKNAEKGTTMSHYFSFTGLNHVAFCVENLERSLEFYCTLLGLKMNIDRPDLPYRGAWLFLGADGIHLMEVPNPDPVKGRPAHGGYDRHACLNCKNVEGVRVTLEKAGIAYQPSPVPSLFTRDPDGNGLEFIEVDA